VVLDTNVLVSGYGLSCQRTGEYCLTWRQGGLDVVLSHYILDEMVRVLPRLTRLRMSSQEIRDLADCLMFMADIVEPLESRDPQLRDEKDQPVLQTFLVSTADYLIDRRQGSAGSGRSVSYYNASRVLVSSWEMMMSNYPCMKVVTVCPSVW
jgi:putative toxin-antitoxin system toxin component, PIN family